MIITQTPLRVSFVGGGTDLPDYYRNNGGGAVISTAIDKYIFVIVKERFDDKIRLGYSRTEMVDSVDELKHELVREAMRKVGVWKRIEIGTMADIPSTGSGLGSSSSVTVGILNALYLYVGEPKEPEVLAEQACEIEIDILGKPIGKQDQYAAALGNMNVIRFLPDERVEIERVELSNYAKRMLNSNLLLFYTGISRESSTILEEQKAEIPKKEDILSKMKNMVDDVKACFLNEEIDQLGPILHQGWLYKKQLAGGISNPTIDLLYEKALSAGATGGKVVGAGGGGFLLVYCPNGKQDDVRNALSDYRELPFRFEKYGTKSIFNMTR